MTVAEHFKAFKKVLKFLKPFLIIAVLATTLIVVGAMLWQGDDRYRQQKADLQEEFRGYGVRYFVYSSDFSSLISEPVDSKDDFCHLLVKYEPKIIYYYSTGRAIYFMFFEDETEAQIAYEWIYEYER